MSKINIPVDYRCTEDEVDGTIRITFEIKKGDMIHSLLKYNHELFERGYKTGYMAAESEITHSELLKDAPAVIEAKEDREGGKQ